MGFRTDEELKVTYAKTLRSQGYGVSLDVPVGEAGARIDILTDSEIIACTLDLTEQTAVTVKSQLDFYGQFCPTWKKVVAVGRITSPEVVDRLSQSGIALVTVMAPDVTGLAASQPLGGEKGSRDKSQLPPRFTYSPAHDYKSFEGGKGYLAALYVLTLVVLMGLAGWVVSLQKRPPEWQQSAGIECLKGCWLSSSIEAVRMALLNDRMNWLVQERFLSQTVQASNRDDKVACIRLHRK